MMCVHGISAALTTSTHSARYQTPLLNHEADSSIQMSPRKEAEEGADKPALAHCLSQSFLSAERTDIADVFRPNLTSLSANAAGSHHQAARNSPRKRTSTLIKPTIHTNVTKMPTGRHASIDVFISLWLTVLFTSTATAANHQPFAMKVSRQYDNSPPSIFRRYCEISWLEGNCKIHDEFRWLRRRKWVGRHPGMIPRGGSQQQHETEILPAQHMIPLSSLPLIDTKSVSLALRLTCETNRRLHHGTSIVAGASTDFLAIQHTQQHLAPTLCTRTIQSISETEQIKERRMEELTVFHCMDLGDRMGDEKCGNITESPLPFGPDLESYLNALLCAINTDKNYSDSSNTSSTARTITHNKSPTEDETQVILSLTILYLDRSTSMSSPVHVHSLTGQQILPQCPHVLPQTVHRLLLTALSIATKFVRGDNAISNLLRDVANSMMDERHAISLLDMKKMEDWMIQAMGSTTGLHTIQHHHLHETSWQTSHDEISRFLRKWGGTFYPQRLAAHDQTRMEQQERFWREQLSANHGHGNFWADRSSMEYPSSHDGEHQWHYPGHH